MPPVRFDSVRTPRAPLPLFARFVLIDAEKIERRLDDVARSGLVPRVPNAWQIALGVLRMWHRLVFRSEEIGTSASRPRSSWRARLLHYRPLRFPFLLAERAVAPLDSSGLLSSRERVLRHMVGAHHEGAQFVYDLEMLSVDQGAFDELVRRAREVVENDTPRTRWLRDLTVYEGYHEALLAAAERALRGEFDYPPERADDPDTRFVAYLGWCARQPATYEATLAAWRTGRYTIADGLAGARGKEGSQAGIDEGAPAGGGAEEGSRTSTRAGAGGEEGSRSWTATAAKEAA